VKLVLATAAALAVLVAAGSASPHPASPAACPQLVLLPRATPAGDVSLFGHIASLTRGGSRYVLRFDPALLLTGMTAARAKLEDTGSAEVPNDYWIRDPDHKLLSFWVPAATPVTDLVQGSCTHRTTVAALAAEHSKAGFWIRVHVDTVRSIDQQFQP
jgi:hypothetical protein